jgi:hypothetical protein
VSETKDDILERFRLSIPLDRTLAFECPVTLVTVPLRWLAIATVELAGWRAMRYERDEQSSQTETDEGE